MFVHKLMLDYGIRLIQPTGDGVLNIHSVGRTFGCLRLDTRFHGYDGGGICRRVLLDGLMLDDGFRLIQPTGDGVQNYTLRRS